MRRDALLARGIAAAALPTASGVVEVAVVYTSVRRTLSALRSAAGLARGLNARIQLAVPEVVPFPAQLDQPPVDSAFTERKFRTLAEESEIETRVVICRCRDWDEAVLECLKRRSVVVVGVAPSWWRSRRERRLARILRARGHHVVLVNEHD